MKKRYMFSFYLILLIWFMQQQSNQIEIKQPESTILKMNYNVSIATNETPTPIITSTPTLMKSVATATIELNQLLSKTIVLKTIQDYRNNVPEGYTLQEFDLLAKLIWGEARGESSECQIAIGQVVLNRSRIWHQSVESVIYASGQFTVAHPKRKFLRIKPTIKEYVSAYAVLSGDNVISDEALYFHSTSLGKRAWGRSHHYEKTIDRTSFYKQ